MQIAHRTALTLAKKRTAARPVAPVTGATVEKSDGALDERLAPVLAAVVKLPEHERRTVMLHYLDGHSVRDVAEITGLAVGTITKQLTRGRERLRRLLEATP